MTTVGGLVKRVEDWFLLGRYVLTLKSILPHRGAVAGCRRGWRRHGGESPLDDRKPEKKFRSGQLGLCLLDVVELG